MLASPRHQLGDATQCWEGWWSVGYGLLAWIWPAVDNPRRATRDLRPATCDRRPANRRPATFNLQSLIRVSVVAIATRGATPTNEPATCPGAGPPRTPLPRRPRGGLRCGHHHPSTCQVLKSTFCPPSVHLVSLGGHAGPGGSPRPNSKTRLEAHMAAAAPSVVSRCVAVSSAPAGPIGLHFAEPCSHVGRWMTCRIPIVLPWGFSSHAARSADGRGGKSAEGGAPWPPGKCHAYVEEQTVHGAVTRGCGSGIEDDGDGDGQARAARGE